MGGGVSACAADDEQEGHSSPTSNGTNNPPMATTSCRGARASSMRSVVFVGVVAAKPIELAALLLGRSATAPLSHSDRDVQTRTLRGAVVVGGTSLRTCPARTAAVAWERDFSWRVAHNQVSTRTDDEASAPAGMMTSSGVSLIDIP